MLKPQVSRAKIELIDKNGNLTGKTSFAVLSTEEESCFFSLFDNLDDLNCFINEFRDEFDLKE